MKNNRSKRIVVKNYRWEFLYQKHPGLSNGTDQNKSRANNIDINVSFLDSKSLA